MESGTTEKLPYPKAVGFIVANEFCERFSFYGMRTSSLRSPETICPKYIKRCTTLTTEPPKTTSGTLSGPLPALKTTILSLYLSNKLAYSDDTATIIFHVFTMFAYFFPLLGAMIADGWLGRFRTIFYLSLVYATGTVLLSLTAMPPLNFPSVELTLLALLLIAVGTGGIKPCVSAFGGDQFKLPEQERYLSYFFSLFYFSINAGSLISTFLTPILRADVKCFGDYDCYSLAFGVPAVLMIISIILFVAGRRLYTVKNPSGNVLGKVATCITHAAVKSCKSKEKRDHWLDHADDKYDPGLIEDVKSLLRVLVLFIPLPVFWALFDQQGSRWTFQATRMDQDIGSWQLKADQMQVLNPLLILAFIPLFEVVIYPFLNWCKLIRKPLHKMIWGGMLAACAFVISGIVELSLVPTYGTPVSNGLAQLRVYNGFDCNITLTMASPTANNDSATASYEISPLSLYENLKIEAKGFIELPYSLRGEANSECANIAYSGTFHLLEKTANSFFINREKVFGFTDKNDKVNDGFNVRFLSNLKSTAQIKVLDPKKNRTKLTLESSDLADKFLEKGTYDVIVGEDVVIKDYNFKVGAVYTINIYQGNTNFIANPVMITPANTVHILWLIPQYVVMTMGEVMFSVTGLEFSFTQAPSSMKSVLQSVWLLTVAFGNLIVVLIVEGNFLDAQWKEFFLFAGLMLVDMFIFAAMAFRYRYAELRSSTEDMTAINMTEKPPTKERHD